MAVYARIQNGVVAELFTPPAGVSITECFAPGLVWVDCSATAGVAPGWTATQSGGGWTFTAPVVAAPSLAQLAAVALGAGVTITISGTLTLAPTLFPCDTTTQAKLLAMDNMAQKGVLPSGQAAYAMKDSAGQAHEFTAAQYQAVVAAIAAYTAALVLIADGISTATALPSPDLTVAV